MSPDGTFDAIPPKVLFAARFLERAGGGATNFDVSLDGRRFVMVRQKNPQEPTVIHIVLNWQEALRASNRE